MPCDLGEDVFSASTICRQSISWCNLISIFKISLASPAALYLPLMVVVAFLHHWRRTYPARHPESEDSGENGATWFRHQKLHISNLRTRWKWSLFNSNSVILYMGLFFHFLRLAGLVKPETQMLFILNERNYAFFRMSRHTISTFHHPYPFPWGHRFRLRKQDVGPSVDQQLNGE